MGCARFTLKAEPAVVQVPLTRGKAQAALDCSDLESRRRGLANLSSGLPSKLAVKPHVTLAHEPLAALYAADLGAIGAIPSIDTELHPWSYALRSA